MTHAHRIVLATVAAALFTAGCASGSDGGSTSDVIIGTTVPLTSAVSASGESQLTGYETAIEYVNGEGGVCDGRQLRLEVKDDQFDPAKAKSLTRELIIEDGAVALLGPFGSAPSLTMSAEAEAHDVPGVYPLSSSEEMVTRGFKGVFNLFALSVAQEEAADEFLTEVVDPGSVAIYYADNPFSISGAEASKKTLEAAGVDVPVFEKFAQDTSDFVDLVSRAQQADVDVVKHIGYEPQHIAFMQAVTQVDLAAGAVYSESDVPFLSRVLDQLGEAAELGLGNPLVPSNADSPLMVALKAEMGEDPPNEAIRSTAAVQVLAAALDAADCGDAQEIREALAATDLSTPVGQVSFDERGAFTGPVPIGQIQDGETVIVWPKDLATGTYLPWTQPSSR